MNNISNIGRGAPSIQDMGTQQPKASEPGKFSKLMGNVADGALTAASVVAPLVPGGQLIQAAVGGLKELRGSGPDLGGAGDQMDKMWAMQRENQVFNLQYMQLQEATQSDNRRFSTMSNLMKVRHDTAKAAINNMHV